MSKLTLGIDEAGRGPVLGPMVMAAVCLDTRGARVLSRAGLRDSKSYGPPERARSIRAELARKIRDHASFIGIEVVDVAEIDRRVRRNELNVLEREVAARLIDRGPCAHRIIADGTTLFAPLAVRYSQMVAWNKAEERHAAVAAASVIAKHRRDEIFERISLRYAALFGEVRGGGYSNAATRAFLCAYAEKFGRLPPEARRSWPHPYLWDILGRDFDPFADLGESEPVPGQLRLL